MESLKRQIRLLGMLVVMISVISFLIIGISGSPIALLANEFKIPTAITINIVNLCLDGSSIITIMSIIGGLATGGLGLIAAAGRETIRAYIVSQVKKRGAAATAAW
jgi:circularin A/uberolysin family circular bacteriocin